MLAAEVGANIDVAKTGGLLHDIGKALSHEVEGPHAEIGADVARRYGIPVEVQRPSWSTTRRYGLGGGVPGAGGRRRQRRPPRARKDTLEHYVRRMEALENAAKSFPGIEKCFAIQAGREVRIMVKSDILDDVASSKMARDVVKKIEEDLVYPGQIKVTVIRETRSVEYAR